MHVRQTLLAGLALSLVTIVSVFTIDGPIASLLQSSAAANRHIVSPLLTPVELLFGFTISKFALGAALVVLAALLAIAPARRPLARLLFFVGFSHLLTRLIAGVLKNVFLRARPHEALAGSWFVDGGSSFPSGHAAHFWALFFALALAFPRLRIPALVLAIAVSAARVVVNDHFVSDVLGSAAIAAFVCGATSRTRRPRRAPEPTG